MKCVKEFKCKECKQIKKLEDLIFLINGCVCTECIAKEKEIQREDIIGVL